MNNHDKCINNHDKSMIHDKCINNHDKSIIHDELCWIYDNNIVWKKAFIKQKKNIKAIVLDTNNDEHEIEISKLLLRNSDNNDNCNNLINLIHLNEASILNSIYIRYTSDKIYTFNNNILISMNPFKHIDIYNEKTIELYKNNLSYNLDPHPFIIAKNSLSDLLKNNKNQSILVSGESGSGKTQTTKILMNYITNVSKTEFKNMENKILFSNTILEAFGNAKTIRNNNSSRFGKFIKLLFNNDKQLMGAKIQTYLLEKIRITNLSKNERNFHIFYILINSLDAIEKQKLFINNQLDEYNYLNKSNKYYRNDNINDKDQLNELMKSFKLLNFNKNTIFNIFKIISFILNLGNIDNLMDLKNNIFLNNCVNLLEINIDEMIDIFTYKYLYINNEIIKINNTNSEFIIIRDSFAQILYILLFNFIVDTINVSIENSYSKYIGILDIFGFEVFDNNGFEQLCINYTNEKLQNLFNKYIFDLEQCEYKNEEIEWNHIDYPNNKKILNVIENKSKSIFSILIEQSILKSGNDTNFYNNIVNKLENNNYFEVLNKYKVNKQFNIKHYAGKVCYKVKDFIFKNKNQSDKRFKNILNKNNFISNNFNLSNLNISNKSIKSNSIIYQFKSQLNNLVSNILKTNQNYIRCIKPNDQDLENNFIHKRVFEQLKYCGVLEAIKIARAGYPVRIKNYEFINKFYVSMNILNIKPYNIYNFIKKIYPNVNKSVMQLGKTKVFLKKKLYEIIVVKNNNNLKYFSNIIQKNYRKYKTQKIYTILKNVIINIQYIVKKTLRIKIKSIEIIKNYISKYIIRNLYINKKKKIIKIQKNVRRFQYRKKYLYLLTTISIQSFLRMFYQRKKFKTKIIAIKSIIKIQKQYQVYKFRKIVKYKIIKVLNLNNKFILLQNQLKHKKNSLKLMEQEKLKQKEDFLKLMEQEKLKQKEDFLKLMEQEKLKQKENFLKLMEQEKKENMRIKQHDIKITKRVNSIIGNKMETMYLQLDNSNEEIQRLKQLYKNKNKKCTIM